MCFGDLDIDLKYHAHSDLMLMVVQLLNCIYNYQFECHRTVDGLRKVLFLLYIIKKRHY